MSRVLSQRTFMNCLIGLITFIVVIVAPGCSPIPSDALLVNGPDPNQPDDQQDNADDLDQDQPSTDEPGDDTPPLPPDTETPDNTDTTVPAGEGSPDVGADDVPLPDDSGDDINVAETPPDVFEETPFPPPLEDTPPADPNPPTGGTGGNPDPPAQDPPAQDPPAQDPPAEDPPAEDPPAEDPPAEDPPANDPPSDWPNNAYCATSANWDATYASYEEQVLVLVNQRRAAGANCGSAGSFAATTPLTMNSALRCAARNHSLDMNVRDFFSHTNPDGQGPGYRIGQSGYSFSWWGENIAWGYPTPESVVNGWMNSPGHCANIMNANFTEIGVGYYQDNYWTQTFGRP